MIKMEREKMSLDEIEKVLKGDLKGENYFVQIPSGSGKITMASNLEKSEEKTFYPNESTLYSMKLYILKDDINSSEVNKFIIDATDGSTLDRLSMIINLIDCSVLILTYPEILDEVTHSKVYTENFNIISLKERIEPIEESNLNEIEDKLKESGWTKDRGLAKKGVKLFCSNCGRSLGYFRGNSDEPLMIEREAYCEDCYAKEFEDGK
ncbi:hypothetical protein AKJ51_04200 [candidate division MSBL1 archaeon SCGC-AAA382A20]|uniref:Uncharacterized protein n=1 Tax=candidate division MSBL1 archaeon SCGC-AAA382A20 TaxID=1698280 RepID=A0A133VI20_9EURY|nr:hypothetical protein AKJ51_04200 [candidate division MSBL1 archaeon SCGC-AAA382A20]